MLVLISSRSELRSLELQFRRSAEHVKRSYDLGGFGQSGLLHLPRNNIYQNAPSSIDSTRRPSTYHHSPHTTLRTCRTTIIRASEGKNTWDVIMRRSHNPKCRQWKTPNLVVSCIFMEQYKFLGQSSDQVTRGAGRWHGHLND